MDLLSYSLVFLVPVSVVTGYLIGGMFTFLTPLVVFGIIPILDMIIGRDTRNPDPAQVEALENRKAFRILTWLCAPVQLALVFWGATIAAYQPLSPAEWIGFVLSVGVSSGVLGINVAHELAHRINGKLEPFLSRTMLWTVFYMHWGLEHVVGHHRDVATPADPATARLGESFYSFWPRTVAGAFNSAWEFESKRLQKKGQQPAWTFRNRVVTALAMQLLLLLAVTLFFGWLGLLYWILQAVIAFSLLEIVNYVEHYGLLRKRTDDNKYESVKPVHSWNSSHWLTNRFLFNLQRHSDHHYRPGRRYQVLRHFDESPQLPNGYAGMVILAAIPLLWHRIMDRRVKELNKAQ